MLSLYSGAEGAGLEQPQLEDICSKWRTDSSDYENEMRLKANVTRQWDLTKWVLHYSNSWVKFELIVEVWLSQLRVSRQQNLAVLDIIYFWISVFSCYTSC